MIQHLSQSTSKRRNLKTKETIRSGKILRRDQFTLNFKIKAVEDFLKEKQNFPNVKTQSFLDNNLECGNGKKLRESTFRGWIKDFEKIKQLSIKIGFVKGDRISLMLRKKLLNT